MKPLHLIYWLLGLAIFFSPYRERFFLIYYIVGISFLDNPFRHFPIYSLVFATLFSIIAPPGSPESLLPAITAFVEIVLKNLLDFFANFTLAALGSFENPPPSDSCDTIFKIAQLATYKNADSPFLGTAISAVQQIDGQNQEYQRNMATQKVAFLRLVLVYIIMAGIAVLGLAVAVVVYYLWGLDANNSVVQLPQGGN